MAANTIEGVHTCLICKGKFNWSATISKEPIKQSQVEVVVASTFFTVDQGRKADLEIYAKCPSCQTKYKFESSCPVEMIC
ncbi:hypothetical protein [Ammoniphilus sp. 3BR4]|uniref:hypothetical protein n=1 Tax=Ammoniphilus sp. 3BR4 TaxID=3158265 RepID=UPI003465E150